MEILSTDKKKYKLQSNVILGEGSNGKIMLIHEIDKPKLVFAAKQLKLEEN